MFRAGREPSPNGGRWFPVLVFVLAAVVVADAFDILPGFQDEHPPAAPARVLGEVITSDTAVPTTVLPETITAPATTATTLAPTTVATTAVRRTTTTASTTRPPRTTTTASTTTTTAPDQGTFPPFDTQPTVPVFP